MVMAVMKTAGEVEENTSNNSQLQLETVLVSGMHYMDIVEHDDKSFEGDWSAKVDNVKLEGEGA